MTEADYKILKANMGTLQGVDQRKPRAKTTPKKVAPLRRQRGKMNKTEAFYAAQVLGPLLHTRKITEWKFEPAKLTLVHSVPGGVNGMTYEPDFLAVFPDHVRFIEVKGARKAMKEDAWVKLKMACESFPFWGFSIAFVNPRSGSIEEEKLT